MVPVKRTHEIGGRVNVSEVHLDPLRRGANPPACRHYDDCNVAVYLCDGAPLEIPVQPARPCVPRTPIGRR